jgi:hypothetical protein
MPKVGDKHFPSTSAGEKAARAHAKKTGQKLVLPKSRGNKNTKRKGY